MHLILLYTILPRASLALSHLPYNTLFYPVTPSIAYIVARVSYPIQHILSCPLLFELIPYAVVS
jgi:hypothetical protein